MHTEEHALRHSVLESAIPAGETLLNKNAILLPEVWDYFTKIIIQRYFKIHAN